MNYKAAKTFILQKMESELTNKLTYHGIHHTLDVLKITSELCSAENISQKNTTLLKTAALFHDSGFTETYTNHEEKGCEIARINLPKFDYTSEAIEKICGMVMATKIPQSPQNILEQNRRQIQFTEHFGKMNEHTFFGKLQLIFEIEFKNGKYGKILSDNLYSFLSKFLHKPLKNV